MGSLFVLFKNINIFYWNNCKITQYFLICVV